MNPKPETRNPKPASFRVLDVTFRNLAENLAFDEVLLDAAESGKTSETLRFWESPMPFVVLGVSQVLRQEVWEKNCREDHIRILRRASAGGCVLQGPGCLNFSLVLSHARHPEIETIRSSYCYILGRVCETLQRHSILAHHKGVSDIAIGGRKVSGNAQKRRKRCILHHGTLLYEVDIEKMERYLREPVERPQYRGPRTHSGFLYTIPLNPQQLRDVVCEAFGVDFHPLKPHRAELEAAKELAYEKYMLPEWIERR